MKKRIWIMNHYATNMYFNEGGRHYWFAENLMKQGYEPTIFCANTRHNSNDVIDLNGQLYSVRTKNGIPFVFVKTHEYKSNGKSRIFNMLSFYKNIFPTSKKYAQEFGSPDIILASSVHPLTLVAGIKIAQKFNIPCICEIRDLWPEAIFAFNKVKERSPIGRVLVAGEYWIYKKADALIFTKEGDVNYIKEKKWDLNQGGDIDLSKSYYINNGVDLDAFNKSILYNQVDDPDLTNNKFTVMYVGAIRPVNNVQTILDAAAELLSKKDIQFLVYGNGSHRERLERRVRQEDLKNVKIKGYINKKFVPYVLSKSSVNILNYSQSHYNWSRGNSSNKLFEYMASGKPIISTVKTGYSVIEKYKCGIELENATGEQLASSIMTMKCLAKEDYQRMGNNAKQGVKEFDFKILTEKLIYVFDRALEESRDD